MSRASRVMVTLIIKANTILFFMLNIYSSLHAHLQAHPVCSGKTCMSKTTSALGGLCITYCHNRHKVQEYERESERDINVLVDLCGPWIRII